MFYHLVNQCSLINTPSTTLSSVRSYSPSRSKAEILKLNPLIRCATRGESSTRDTRTLVKIHTHDGLTKEMDFFSLVLILL